MATQELSLEKWSAVKVGSDQSILTSAQKMAPDTLQNLEWITDWVTLVDGVDTYVVEGPDCYQKPAQLQKTFFIVSPDRCILNVTQQCVAGPEVWSFNPDGGFDIWVQYAKQRTLLEWRRWHTSHPVTYQIRVYWKFRNK